MTYHRGFTHSLVWWRPWRRPAMAYGAGYVVPAARENRLRFLLIVWLCLDHPCAPRFAHDLWHPAVLALECRPAGRASRRSSSSIRCSPLLLLVGVLMLVFRRKKPDEGRPAHRAFFSAAMIYLAIGIAGHMSVRARAAANPAFAASRIFVQPAPLTILYWQVLGLEDGHYVDGRHQRRADLSDRRDRAVRARGCAAGRCPGSPIRSSASNGSPAAFMASRFGKAPRDHGSPDRRAARLRLLLPDRRRAQRPLPQHRTCPVLAAMTRIDSLSRVNSFGWVNLKRGWAGLRACFHYVTVIPEAGLPEIFDFAGKPSCPGSIVRASTFDPGSRLASLAAKPKAWARLTAGMTKIVCWRLALSLGHEAVQPVDLAAFIGAAGLDGDDDVAPGSVASGTAPSSCLLEG